MTEITTNAMEILVERVAGDPRFIGAALAEAGLLHDRTAAAARLGCSPEQIPRLALCRRPDPTNERFADDVRRIAEFVRCDPVRLRDLLRETSAVGRLRGSAGGSDVGQGLLLAARDRRPHHQQTPDLTCEEDE
jgi:hypothetical protein